MCQTRTRRWRDKCAAIAFLQIAIIASPIWAHETDQFTTPPDGQKLADVSSFLEQYFLGGLEKAVEQANRKIASALAGNESKVYRARTERKRRRLRAISCKDPKDRVARLQTPDGITAEYRHTFLPGPTLIESTERLIRRDDQLQSQYPDHLPLYKSPLSKSIFRGVDALPHSNFARLWRGATINAYGSEFGVDKIGHFIHFGYAMFLDYRRRVRTGLPAEQAMDLAAQAQINSASGERGLYGRFMVGSYSNGDLASNYVGCLFFRNLTEPVQLKGLMRPPLLVREGPYWKIADHVRQDPHFFSWYISDHFNEALNPSLYRKNMRKKLRKNIANRHAAFLDYYCNNDDHHRTKAYFDNVLKELSTYYGQDYGHRGDYHELVSIGNMWPGEAGNE